jgi:hypothetical protein
MPDENLIASYEESLRLTRNEQNRLFARLREVENEAQMLRQEIDALEHMAVQTGQNIDSLLVTMKRGSRPMNFGKSTMIEDADEAPHGTHGRTVEQSPYDDSAYTRYRRDSVAYIHNSRGIPSINNNLQPISTRFGDRTITQACTLLLREAGGPLHVNELYNLLVVGGMKFKGNNPTISIAVSLNRNKRFRKVDPGTFDLVMREAIKKAL